MTASISPEELVSVSANLAQHDLMTYAELLEHFEPGHPQLTALIAALESGKPYDLDGLDIRLVKPAHHPSR